MTETQTARPASTKPPGPASKLGIWVMAGTLVIDQIAKWIAEATLDVNSVVDILPMLSLYLTYNTGMAFSFLRGTDSTLMLGLVIIVTLVVLTLWARANEGGRLATLGFGLIIGGAVGNIIDRLAYGHVVDFLRLYIGDRTLFVFNLADFALTLGPVVLIVAFLRAGRTPDAT